MTSVADSTSKRCANIKTRTMSPFLANPQKPTLLLSPLPSFNDAAIPVK